MTTRQELYKLAKDLGIAIKPGNEKTYNKNGIHLINADDYELADAIETAERDLIPTVYLYTVDESVSGG